MAFSKLTRGQDNAGFQKLEQCGVIEDDWIRLLGNDGLAQKVAEQFIASRAPVPTEPLLKFGGTVPIPATASRFTADFCFQLNKTANGLPQISYLGENFSKWFLDKVEEPLAETTLVYHQLERSSVDGPILAELGGEEKVETSLTAIFTLMSLQKTGQAGILLNNGYANIFYVRDVMNNVLRAVSVSWYGGGWDVVADPVGYPGTWRAGRRVFSRNSGALDSLSSAQL